MYCNWFVCLFDFLFSYEIYIILLFVWYWFNIVIRGFVIVVMVDGLVFLKMILFWCKYIYLVLVVFVVDGFCKDDVDLVIFGCKKFW